MSKKPRNNGRRKAAKDASPARPNVKSDHDPAAGKTAAHDQIARRAYEIWCATGCPPGQDVSNWREAEQQLRNEHP